MTSLSGPLGLWEPVSVDHNTCKVSHGLSTTVRFGIGGQTPFSSPSSCCFLCKTINMILPPFRSHSWTFLLPRERKGVGLSMMSLGNWERIVVKDHHRPHVIKLNRIEPRRSGSANNARSHCRPRCKLGNRLAKLETRKSSRYLRDTISTLTWHTMT